MKSDPVEEACFNPDWDAGTPKRNQVNEKNDRTCK